MTAREAVEKARECLEKVTPLESDCGELCAARCCRSLEGEETGMLLFPGEEERYQHMEGWKVLSGSAGNVVVCPGRCNRNERPLSCRIFPLLPVVRKGEIVIRPIMNLRLTADHRVIDGVKASRFLQRVAEILENPYLLMS